MEDTLICYSRTCEKPADGTELEDPFKNETRDEGLYKIKYINNKNPECYRYLKKANELMQSCFGTDAPTKLPKTMPGIVVCIKCDTDELIGLLYIEDEFNNNRSLLWCGGESTKPQSQCEYNYFQIRGMCIKNEYRSKGFGSQLLNFAKKLGSANGFDYMFATIDLDEDEDTDRRIKFYKKNNFYKQILSLTNSNESPPLNRSEKKSVRYISYISDKDDEDIFGNRYKMALSQEGTDDYTNGPSAPPRVVTFICSDSYCMKSKNLSAEEVEWIEKLKNSGDNIGKRIILFIDEFITSCNKPDDYEINKLINLVRKLAGAYKEFEKLPEQSESSIRPQLDQIGVNMRDMIIALVPIPRTCRHEHPYCVWCESDFKEGCGYCPDNISVNHRSKRWSQHARKCDAGPLIRLMKSHQNGANRVAARANDLDYSEENTAARLFEEL